MSFEADDKHVYDLFTKRCYGTPRNQRQYVWNKRNWQELFDDVLLVATGIDINERTNIMAMDFYNRILKSSICSVQKNTNDTKMRKQGIETKSTIKKTIGNMMKKANHSTPENDLPDVQQLSFL